MTKVILPSVNIYVKGSVGLFLQYIRREEISCLAVFIIESPPRSGL
jgi:hypothetical protein